MPENNDTPEEIHARKVTGEVEFLKDTIDKDPAVSIGWNYGTALTPGDNEETDAAFKAEVVAAMKEAGYAHRLWAGQDYFAASEAILDENYGTAENPREEP